MTGNSPPSLKDLIITRWGIRGVVGIAILSAVTFIYTNWENVIKGREGGSP